MRVLVTGSRNWSNHELIWDVLYGVLGKHGNFTLVHGDCPTGADSFADTWAYEVDLENVERYPADWNGPRKKGAGFARNAEMVNLGADLCFAFILDGSNGATHCSELAKKAGIETIIFEESSLMAKPQKRVKDEIKLENIRMIWRNFAGEEKQFNVKGKRNFAIPLEEDLALTLAEIGWNVKDNKEKVARGEADELLYHLPVTVKMDGRVPPRMFMITKVYNHRTGKDESRRTQLDEDTVMLLDFAEFDNVDVILRPFNWEVQGKQGVAAYVKTLYAILHQDDLEKKYAHIPLDNGQLALEAGDDVIDVEGEWVEDDADMDALGDIEQRDVRERKALERGRA